MLAHLLNCTYTNVKVFSKSCTLTKLSHFLYNIQNCTWWDRCRGETGRCGGEIDVEVGEVDVEVGHM